MSESDSPLPPLDLGSEPGTEKENAQISPMKSVGETEMERKSRERDEEDVNGEKEEDDGEEEEKIDEDNNDKEEENDDVEMVTLDDDEEEEEGKEEGAGPRKRRKSGAPPGSVKRPRTAPSTPKTPGVSKEEREAERAKKKLEREQAAEAKRLEKERIIKEKEEAKEAKRREEEEKKEQKRKEEEERKEKKRKEEEERKEKKRKEEEEKNEEKRKKEEERRKKEEEKAKKKVEEEEKKELKRKEEEEKKEMKRKEEEAAEEKKRRASNRFISFFKKEEKKEDKSTASEELKEDASSGGLWFKPFPIKPFMTLAPVLRREPLSDDVDVCSYEGESPKYLAGLKGRKLNCIEIRPLKAKLFQFHDNYRPPYYGTWRKRAKHIRGRRPLAKEETLDYEVESDAEWEEEPSDAEECNSDDEDQEDEEMEEEENEGFIVGHGYLSEGEGDSNDDEDMMDEEGEDDSKSPSASDVEATPGKKRKRKAEKKRPRRVLLSDDEEDCGEEKRGRREGGEEGTGESGRHARHSPSDAAARRSEGKRGRDAEEERRVRLASRADEFKESVARKTKKLIPRFWWNLVGDSAAASAAGAAEKGVTVEGAGGRRGDEVVVRRSDCPESVLACRLVTIEWPPVEEDQAGDETPAI